MDDATTDAPRHTPDPDDPDYRAWREAYEQAALRDAPWETMSGVPIDPIYGDGPYPGQYPYTRGVYPSMYRSRLWTMRMFAGFGTAEDTNARFHDILRNGGTGLSTAFDMPTLMGRDSDSPWSTGEVGRAGVAVDTLADMEDLYAGIDLGGVSTSMTINGPAAIVLAMYIAVGEKNGVPRERLAGTIQNDIFKEYQAQKEYIYPPRPSVRIVTDMIRFTAAEMPRWHPVSISGYHIREAGSTAAQELAFTLANGFAYVEAATQAGVDVDEFAGRLSFFFNSHTDFFEEIGKFPGRPAHLGPLDEGALRGRAGALAAVPVPHPDRGGVAHRPAARDQHRPGGHPGPGRRPGRHPRASTPMPTTRPLALPTEKAARIALRTQQIVAHETGAASVIDPLGGAPYVEWMTDEMERQAEAIFAHLDDLGNGSILEGVYAGIENGYFVGEIADSAYRFEREVNAGRRVIVGVNAFTDGDEADQEILRIDAAVEDYQLKRLEDTKARRDGDAVARTLAAVTAAAEDPTANLMPPILDAVNAYATLEEVVAAMEQVFGTYVEKAIV